MVLVGWAIDVPMSLYFSTFETAILFVSVFITNLVILDGESNWLEGAMLLSTYLIIALAFSIIQMLIRFNYHDDKKEEERRR